GRTFQPGELLWREGDLNGMMVCIMEGHVKIYNLTPEGNAITHYIFGPDDIFGFMPLFDDEPYPVHAQAVDVVRARVVTREALHEAVSSDPHLAIFLIRLLSKRLREAMRQSEMLSSRGFVNKVAMALSSLIPPKGADRDTSILTLAVSSRDFSSLYGLSPESFSRGITALVQEGIIHRLGNNSFQVLDYERLRQFAAPRLI
ncbi:Crp/Fnr family transcriptional regulator, partial [Myxococcota bacterium]|nr:Crp/Fnr family transcriptional regulator [Myxococcota bacterium]